MFCDYFHHLQAHQNEAIRNTVLFDFLEAEAEYQGSAAVETWKGLLRRSQRDVFGSQGWNEVGKWAGRWLKTPKYLMIEPIW